MFSIKDGRGAFYQWDTGREITCPEGVDQIHFGNTAYGRALDVDVVEGTARVPDVLLQSDKPLHVWAWVGNPENGYTKESEVFRVERRNKPADYVYTPEEQQNLRDAVNEAVAAKEEAAAAASSAALSAGSAQSDAQSANASQKAAQRYLEATEQKYQNTAEVSAIAVQAREASVKAAADSEAFSGNAQDAAADAEKAKAEAQKALEETKENAKGYVKTVNGKGPDANGNVQTETGGGGGSDPDAVKYTPQSLTESQKAQARKNIGVVGTGKDGEDYVLTQADKEEIAGMAAELVDVPEGGGGAQADWNAAEGEPGHVLNRTHWVENGRTEVLSELVFTSYSGNGTSLKEPIGLTAGKTYIVNWNGIEYKCTAFSVPLDDGSASTWTATAIGDWDSINNNTEPVTGEPFGIFEYTQPELIETFGKALYIKPREDTIHDCTVSIYEESEIIHKLDGKYLPNGVPYLEGGGEPVELLPPTKLEEENGTFIVPADAGIVLVDGGNYVVNWNGTEYTCTAQYFAIDGKSGIVIGNIGLAMGGEDTGEPFVILYSEMLAAMGASLNVISLAGDTEVTLVLIGSPPVKIHKLDPKLLPDGVPYAVDSYGALLSNYTIEDQDGLFGLPRLGLVAGNTYDVKINGVGEYHCVAVSTVADGIPVVAIGNVGALTQSGDTGEPFALVELRPDYAAAWGSDVGVYPVGDTITLPVTFSISGGSKEIRKLDNDCLDLAWLPTYLPPETIYSNSALGFTNITPTNGNYFGSAFDPSQVLPLVDGKTYFVTWNGAEYKCTAKYESVNGFSGCLLGNKSVLSTDYDKTGEPFQILAGTLTGVGDLTAFYAEATVEEYNERSAYRNVIITSAEGQPNKMPKEFLPESVATKEYVNEMLGVIENGTY